MRKGSWLALGTLLAAVAAVALSAAPAQSQKPKEETFLQRLARESKTPEEDTNRVYQALGPVIRAELARGKEVAIPGLGTFRVVRVAEHRDLRNGRPVIVPAVNTVEFLSGGELFDAANSDAAVPAETVPPFQYNVLPNQTPSLKVGQTRVAPVRVP